MAVEFQYWLLPMALMIDATQLGPSLPDPGWSECAKSGTIHVTCASSPFCNVGEHAVLRRDHVVVPVLAVSGCAGWPGTPRE
jgi:hypothetical protein